MKALDTSALLAVLAGSPGSKELLRQLRGEEVATTEANLLELATIAAAAPRARRAERFAVLDRLRSRLTVLPVDGRAAEVARRRAGRGYPPSPLLTAALATLEANGCDELITEDPRAIPDSWSFRVVGMRSISPKTRRNRKHG